MKISRESLKRILLSESVLVNVSGIVKFKDEIRAAISIIVDELAGANPKLADVSTKRYNNIIDGVAKEATLALISYLGHNPPGSPMYEEKQGTQALSEAFLPNLPGSPMPLKSSASQDLYRAIKGAFSEAAHSDQELQARSLSNKVRDLMNEISSAFGEGGENDHRSQEAYEYLFRVAERLDAIYEFRE